MGGFFKLGYHMDLGEIERERGRGNLVFGPFFFFEEEKEEEERKKERKKSNHEYLWMMRERGQSIDPRVRNLSNECIGICLSSTE